MGWSCFLLRCLYRDLALYFAAKFTAKAMVQPCDGGRRTYLRRSASYASIWSAPVCFREALVNSRGRIALERELADFLRVLPPDSTLLMYLGSHVGAVQQAGSTVAAGD